MGEVYLPFTLDRLPIKASALGSALEPNLSALCQDLNKAIYGLIIDNLFFL